MPLQIYNAPLVGAALLVYMLLSKAILRGTILFESDLVALSSRTISWQTRNETQQMVSSPTCRPTTSPEVLGGTTNEPEDALGFSSSFWSSLELNGEVQCGKYKCLLRQKIDHDGVGNETVS
jgi:hypothetical protein